MEIWIFLMIVLSLMVWKVMMYSEDSYDGMELGECYDDKDIQF